MITRGFKLGNTESFYSLYQYPIPLPNKLETVWKKYISLGRVYMLHDKFGHIGVRYGKCQNPDMLTPSSSRHFKTYLREQVMPSQNWDSKPTATTRPATAHTLESLLPSILLLSELLQQRCRLPVTVGISNKHHHLVCSVGVQCIAAKAHAQYLNIHPISHVRHETGPGLLRAR